MQQLDPKQCLVIVLLFLLFNKAVFLNSFTEVQFAHHTFH